MIKIFRNLGLMLVLGHAAGLQATCAQDLVQIQNAYNSFGSFLDNLYYAMSSSLSSAQLNYATNLYNEYNADRKQFTNDFYKATGSDSCQVLIDIVGEHLVTSYASANDLLSKTGFTITNPIPGITDLKAYKQSLNNFINMGGASYQETNRDLPTPIATPNFINALLN